MNTRSIVIMVSGIIGWLAMAEAAYPQCHAMTLGVGDKSAVADPDSIFIAKALEADAVVTATLAHRRSFWAPTHDTILTEYDLSVSSVVAGDAPGTVTIVAEGGEVGGVGLLVSTAVSFEPGMLYALLLRRTPGSDRMTVVGDQSGLRRIESGNACQDPVLKAIAATETDDESAEARR